MTKSFFMSFFMVVIALIIETTVLANIYILPVVPDLVLICTVYFSILNGSTYGQLNGFTSGLLIDFISGVPMGLNCLFRTIIGYIYGIFSRHIFITKVFVPIVSVSTATLLKTFLLWLTSILFPLSINSISIFSLDFVFELLFNTLLAPFIFTFLNAFRATIALYDNEDKNINV